MADDDQVLPFGDGQPSATSDQDDLAAKPSTDFKDETQPQPPTRSPASPTPVEVVSTLTPSTGQDAEHPDAADDEYKQSAPNRSQNRTPRDKNSQTNQAISATPSKKGGSNDGADLERRVARVEFGEGALIRLRVPIRVDAEAGRDVLTDIDVLALDVDGRLRVSRSILECKSGRGQAGEPDRLLWLAGLQQFLQFERAVLVRLTVSRRGRGLARTLGLGVMDVAHLARRESAHEWLPDRFAHVDGKECAAAESRADVQLKGLGHINSDLVAFLRHDALRAPTHEALRAIAALGRTVDTGGVLPRPTHEVLAGHALIALLVAAVSDGGLLDEQSPDELLTRTRRALVTGDPDDEQILKVLARADELTRHNLDRVHSAYTTDGTPREQVKIPSLRDLVAEPPAWVPRYVDLVERLRANQVVARDVLLTAELSIFDALMGGSGYQATAFDHLFTGEHRYLLNVAVRCLEQIAGPGISGALAPILHLDFNRSDSIHAAPASSTPVADL